MATKLEREATAISSKMLLLAFDVEEFSKRKLDTLPAGAAWSLLKAALAIMSAASKVQLTAATRHAKDMKKHFQGAVRT